MSTVEKEIHLTKTKSIWIKSLVAGLLMLVGSLFFTNQAATMSIGIGVAIAVANFWLLERLVKALVSQKEVNSGRVVLIFIVKLLVLFGVLGFVMLKVPVEALAFLFGLSCIVVGIVFEGITSLLFVQQGQAEDIN
jgi:hypothetical protein